MKRLRSFPALVFALVVLPRLLAAGELPKSAPEAVGLSSSKLAGIEPALKKLVDDGKIPGGVAAIARHGKIAYTTSFGYRDIAKKTPMTDDTIFAIASMTKPITCTAVMTLVEAGKLGLDDPVAKYIPELKDLRVLGKAGIDTATELATVPAKRGVSVRDLLSHSSGFTYGSFMSNDARLERAYKCGRTGQGAQNDRPPSSRLAQGPAGLPARRGLVVWPEPRRPGC